MIGILSNVTYVHSGLTTESAKMTQESLHKRLLQLQHDKKKVNEESSILVRGYN